MRIHKAIAVSSLSAVKNGWRCVVGAGGRVLCVTECRAWAACLCMSLGGAGGAREADGGVDAASGAASAGTGAWPWAHTALCADLTWAAHPHDDFVAANQRLWTKHWLVSRILHNLGAPADKRAPIPAPAPTPATPVLHLYAEQKDGGPGSRAPAGGSWRADTRDGWWQAGEEAAAAAGAECWMLPEVEYWFRRLTAGGEGAHRPLLYSRGTQPHHQLGERERSEAWQEVLLRARVSGVRALWAAPACAPGQRARRRHAPMPVPRSLRLPPLLVHPYRKVKVSVVPVLRGVSGVVGLPVVVKPLYSAVVSAWRGEQAPGALPALAPPPQPHADRLDQLEAEALDQYKGSEESIDLERQALDQYQCSLTDTSAAPAAFPGTSAANNEPRAISVERHKQTKGTNNPISQYYRGGECLEPDSGRAGKAMVIVTQLVTASAPGRKGSETARTAASVEAGSVAAREGRSRSRRSPRRRAPTAAAAEEKHARRGAARRRQLEGGGRARRRGARPTPRRLPARDAAHAVRL